MAVVAVGAATRTRAEPQPSTCHGTTAAGSLDNGWKLPRSGPNFVAYSDLGALLGRTYVHSTVHAITLDAYAALEQATPDVRFVCGETGFRDGGEFAPHRTHRNGLSVDFMVPVRNAAGESVRLPTHALNRRGYDVDFDADGRSGELSIDFAALAEHIYQLDRAARRRETRLWRVIFASELQRHLQQTERWPYLREHVRFSTRRAWVRHDEHYCVDFELRCE